MTRFLTGTPVAKPPLLTAAAQTKKSWARLLESYEEVPDIFKPFFESWLNDGTAFPYTVLPPVYDGFIRRENQKLICLLNRQIGVLEKADDAFTCTSYAPEDINYIEMGTILLHSWLTIKGRAGHGAQAVSTIKFNTVTDYLFKPFLALVRPNPATPPPLDVRAELAKFDHLARPSFKFMHFGKSSIIPGQQVLGSVWQPDIRAEVVKLFGRTFYRTLAPAHLLILTGRELILIRDDNSPVIDQGVRYGGIFTYIPLSKITSVSLTEKGRSWLVLSIHMPDNDRIESLFMASQQPELERLLAGLLSSTGERV